MFISLNTQKKIFTSIARLRPKFVKFADRNEANAVKTKFDEIV